jgi:hypothetical protein
MRLGGIWPRGHNPFANRNCFSRPAKAAQYVDAIGVSLDETGVEGSRLAIGGKRGIELAHIFERVAEVRMRLRKVRRKRDRLLCSG